MGGGGGEEDGVSVLELASGGQTWRERGDTYKYDIMVSF